MLSVLEMDIRQLSALLAVADHGTFSAAADALHTVQSNVSSHIARLEKELGTPLIDRAQGRLTEEGEAVTNRARRILNELDAVKADVAALRNEVIGDVKIGLIGTTAQWLAPEIMSIMASRYPQAHLTFREAVTSQLEPLLLAGGLDLAVMILPALSGELSTQLLFEEDMVLVLNRDHELATCDTISVSELAGIPLVLPPAGTSARADLDNAAAQNGVRLTTNAEVEGVRLTASLTFGGHGPAILPATALPAFVSDEWRIVGVSDLPRRQVGMARARRTFPSAAARAVRQVLNEVVVAGAELHPGLHLASSIINA
jgi:DNA-binding transcriptional LysR family regulator